MSKYLAGILAVLFALSTPAFASVVYSGAQTIHQEEGAAEPAQPSGEGEGEGGGGSSE
jgi:hypothetical protein